MITRQGVLTALAVLALGVAGAGAVTTAAVASSATAGERAAAASWTPSPEPRFHRLAPRPTPTPTTVTAVVGAYRVRTLVPGERLVTRAEVKAWDEGRAGAIADGPNSWFAEQEITIRCMADHGFFYDPRVLADPPDWSGSDAEQAMYGTWSQDGEAYSWEKAGCIGLAVHLTGNDDNH